MSIAAPPVPTRWPSFLTAGTTFKVDRSFTDYGTADWSLSVFLAGQAVGAFNGPPQITPDGSVYHVVLAPADTKDLVPNGGASLPYTLIERLTGTDGQVVDVTRQRIMVSPDVGIAVAGDFVSPEEQLLAQLQTSLAARISGGTIENYSIAGRSITRIPTPELERMIGRYKWIVYRQRNPGRLGVPGTYSFPSIAEPPWPPGRFRGNSS